MKKSSSGHGEAVVHAVFFLLGMTAVACVLLITIYLVIAGLPALHTIGLKDFFFGPAWNQAAEPAQFGILPIILTSVYGTAGAVVIGVPIGFLASVWLSKAAPARVRTLMDMVIGVLAGIPSVIYGLVGMILLVPAIRNVFHVPDGSGLLASILVLSVMILPSIIKVSVTALDAVPKEYEDGSLALGASQTETWIRVSVPAARSGIAAAIVLGVGRAIGETMAILMVAGNVVNMPSLFQSVRYLTTAIAGEMSYSEGLHRQALFSIALVLFLFIMMLNAALNRLMRRNPS